MVSIAIVNQKGGVGKTSVTLGLASSAAKKDLETLIVDLDPQGNATTGFGLANSDNNKTIYDIFSFARQTI